jgi:hypothetical protein
MALWRDRRRSVAAGVLLAASFTAVLALEQLRTERVRESAVLESVRADWEAAGSVYKVQGRGSEATAMLNVLDSLHCIFVLADADGAPLQSSGLYHEIGAPLPPAYSIQPRLWKFTPAPNPPVVLWAGRYVFVTGAIRDRDDKAYQLTVGRPL